jgi:hypothetical protein
LQDKIYLDSSGAVQMRVSHGEAARRAILSDVSAGLGSDD